MSEVLGQALEALRDKVGGGGFDGSVRFAVEDVGTLRIDEQGAREDDGAPVDCTISGDMETYKALFDGDLSPTGAYMTGRIRIEGDMGVAMRAASLLG
jgi:putative sterol carrier protein